MKKSDIKAKLRENIFSKLKEAEPKQAEKKGAPTGGEKKDDKSYEKNYQELQRKLDGSLLKSSQVMQAAGLGQADSATDRSLFSKKLNRETNDEGGVYQ